MHLAADSIVGVRTYNCLLFWKVVRPFGHLDALYAVFIFKLPKDQTGAVLSVSGGLKVDRAWAPGAYPGRGTHKYWLYSRRHAGLWRLPWLPGPLRSLSTRTGHSIGIDPSSRRSRGPNGPSPYLCCPGTGFLLSTSPRVPPGSFAASSVERDLCCAFSVGLRDTTF
jgi:hypothetical protein